jgi:hypothetical protein
MKLPCCLRPLIFSFSMRSVSCQRKVGDWFFSVRALSHCLSRGTDSFSLARLAHLPRHPPYCICTRTHTLSILFDYEDGANTYFRSFCQLLQFYMKLYQTDCSEHKALYLYSAGAGFESQPGTATILTEMFVSFLIRSRNIPG